MLIGNAVPTANSTAKAMIAMISGPMSCLLVRVRRVSGLTTGSVA